MQKEIKSLSEIGQGKTLLYVYRPNCAACKTTRPVVEEFSVKHPEVDVLLFNLPERPEAEIFKLITSKGATPTFAFYENGKPYTAFLNVNIDVAFLERAMAENESNEVGITDLNILDNLIQRTIKPIIVYALKESCEVCDKMQPRIMKYVEENPTKQLFIIKNSPEWKKKLGLTEPVEMPIVSFFVQGGLRNNSFGEKSEAELVKFFDEAMLNGGGGEKGDCQHAKRVVELEAILKEKEDQIKKLINKLTA